MSAKKRRIQDIPDFQGTYNAIQDILVSIKPNLNKRISDADETLLAPLDDIAVLCEKFLLERPRSKELAQFTDALDREGTELWNASGTVKSGASSRSNSICAALRLCGFRLLQAGMPSKPDIDGLIHMLQLASKTGAFQADMGKFEVAASVLGSAAKYEEQLRHASDPQDLYQRPKALATVVYYCSRMEAAWKEGNDSLARYMLQYITENDSERLALIPVRDRMSVASKLLEIGRSLLSSDGHREEGLEPGKAFSLQAIEWLQKAFTVAEPLEDMETPGSAEVKRAILRNLSRAYVLSSSHDPENLLRAETSLKELLAVVDGVSSDTGAELQEVRWWQLEVLKRRAVAADALYDVIRSLIDHMQFTEESLTSILQELRMLPQHQVLLVSVLKQCLEKALKVSDPTSLPLVNRVLLSMIYQCSRDEDHDRAIRDLQSAFDASLSADVELPRVPATSCLTLLWQFGERHFGIQRYAEAADWYLSGTHQIFKLSRATMGKCYRKAALCYIQQQEYAKASEVIRQCPGDEAPTHYLSLLAAIKQGLEDEAIAAVKQMVQATHFDRKMLLLVTRLAHESDLQGLLHSVLEELLTVVLAQEGFDGDVEAITLIRCLIRLVVIFISDPNTRKDSLIDALIQHFMTAKMLVKTACAQNRAPLVIKDISWLWRSAYNCAVQGCSEWANAEEKTPMLFDLSRELLEVYREAAVVELDETSHLCIVYGSFAAVSGRVFAARKTLAEPAPGQTERLKSLAIEIQQCDNRIRSISTATSLSEEKTLSIQTCLHALVVFEAEISCYLKDWGRLPQIITRAIRSEPIPMDVVETVTDMLWAEKRCPVDVLFTGLEAILRASLDHNSLSVEKFSRWLRATCSILLSRNTAPDRTRVINYIEQAITVLDEHGDMSDDDGEVYPMDERYWLLTTAYNNGLECLHMSMLDDAKRWFEASTVICRFVPDGERQAQKISETYAQLLNRYSSSSS